MEKTKLRHLMYVATKNITEIENKVNKERRSFTKRELDLLHYFESQKKRASLRLRVLEILS
jgi:hypothetical protein